MWLCWMVYVVILRHISCRFSFTFKSHHSLHIENTSHAFNRLLQMFSYHLFCACTWIMNSEFYVHYAYIPFTRDDNCIYALHSCWNLHILRFTTLIFNFAHIFSNNFSSKWRFRINFFILGTVQIRNSVTVNFNS